MESKKSAVWITGASSGIGKALALEFIKNNVFVIGTARRLKLLNDIKKELGNNGIYFEPHSIDLSDKKAIVDFYRTISSNYQIDCLINNAGLTSFKRSIDDSIEEIEKIIQVNLLGSIFTIKNILPDMIERRSGTIINILSMVTQKIFLASSAYSSSKSGLMAYTKVLREEIRDKNIKIINISPGATSTSIWPDKFLQNHGNQMMNPNNIAELVYRIYIEKSNMVVEDIFIRPITGDL